jgi:AcrR family transcriptional regulator
MRSDARRNHDHILAAARELFADEGSKVPVEEIARAAGVGVGTVHRHFPTKDQLVEAVLVWSCGPLLEVLDEALERDDPAAGLQDFLVSSVDVQSANRALAEEMSDAHERSPELTAVKAEITERLAELVRRAQDAGEIRLDVGPGDLRIPIVGLAQTSTASGVHLSTVDKRRFIQIVLDGLRTPAPTTLPGIPPSL